MFIKSAPPSDLAALTIAIPTKGRMHNKRPVEYLSLTIKSLLAKTIPRERRQVHLLLMNCHTPAHEHHALSGLSDKLSASGFELSVVERKNKIFNEKQTTGAQTHHDDREKMLWMQQLKADFIELLETARNFGNRYILRLEDDVIACDHFLAKLFHAAEQKSRRGRLYPFISFFSPDFGFDNQLKPYYAYSQAMLFRNDNSLDQILAYLKNSSSARAVDRLLEDFRCDFNERGMVAFPSLFQHIGQQSSHDIIRPFTSPTFRSELSSAALLRHKAAQPLRFIAFLIAHAKFRLRQSRCSKREHSG